MKPSRAIRKLLISKGREISANDALKFHGFCTINRLIGFVVNGTLGNQIYVSKARDLKPGEENLCAIIRITKTTADVVFSVDDVISLDKSLV